MVDSSASTQQPSPLYDCFLCKKEVSFRVGIVTVTLTLQLKKQTMVPFHPECFFSAAGDEYRHALQCDCVEQHGSHQESLKTEYKNEAHKALSEIVNRAFEKPEEMQNLREKQKLEEELGKLKEILRKERYEAMDQKVAPKHNTEPWWKAL